MRTIKCPIAESAKINNVIHGKIIARKNTISLTNSDWIDFENRTKIAEIGSIITVKNIPFSKILQVPSLGFFLSFNSSPWKLLDKAIQMPDIIGKKIRNAIGNKVNTNKGNLLLWAGNNIHNLDDINSAKKTYINRDINIPFLYLKISFL